VAVGITNPTKENLMTRTLRVLVAATASLFVLTLAATATAASAPKTVQGTVGPDFTIHLSLKGKSVTTLKNGVRYRFLISDRSSIHDFHVTGPGLNRMLTTVDFTGTRSFVLTLRKGVYRYFCDPHASVMHGSFRVV
jgi:plastocyanin